MRRISLIHLQDKEPSEEFSTHSQVNTDPPESSQRKPDLPPLSEQLQLLSTTSSQKCFDDLLSSCYIPLEIWYIRVIIDKVSIPLCCHLFIDNVARPTASLLMTSHNLTLQLLLPMTSSTYSRLYTHAYFRLVLSRPSSVRLTFSRTLWSVITREG